MPARISLKNGVLFRDMDACIFDALYQLACIWEDYNIPTLVVTSGREGKHMETSLHYQGRAVDIRRWNVPEADLASVLTDIRRVLGLNWDVVLEKTHIHVEYDPKELAA